MKTLIIKRFALSLFILVSACKPQTDQSRQQHKTAVKTASKTTIKRTKPHQAQAAKAPVKGAAATKAKKGGDWNDKGIQWLAFEPGLHQAKAQNKAICLVFSTEWCPHCRNYSGVFHDPQIVAMAKNFVMIHLDKDKNSEISKRFAPDGEYIPRTFFLSPQGQLDESLTAGRPKFKYFYNEKDPRSLLAGMQRALKKFE